MTRSTSGSGPHRQQMPADRLRQLAGDHQPAQHGMVLPLFGGAPTGDSVLGVGTGR